MDTESIVALILRHRPDLSREDLLNMAREKMRSIGAGYLTEQGALFLVAADLGIRIDEEIGRSRVGGTAASGAVLQLKDVYSGARDITVVARVMKIYPVKRYSKSDGTPSKLRRLLVYDNDRSMGVNLWDDASDAIERLGIKAGDAIRISRVYVRSGLNGSLVINTSVRSSVEPAGSSDAGTDEGMSSGVEIMRLEDLAVDVSDAVSKGDDNLVVTGVLCSNPVISTYRGRDGEERSVMSMLLQGSRSRIRVVVWDIHYANLAKIMPLNSRVMITGIKVRRDGDRVELHGDAGSIVRVLDAGAGGMMGYTEDYPSLMRLRVLAVNTADIHGMDAEHEDTSATAGARYAIVMDVDKEARDGHGDGTLYLLYISSTHAVSVNDGMIIECIPSRILGYTIYLDEDSYIARSVAGDKEEYAMGSGAGHAHEPISKISDAVREEHLYAIEAIVLTTPRVDEVRRRDGSISRRAEVLVGDDTSEARLVAWDRQVESIEALRVGERIRLYGVVARRRSPARRDYDTSEDEYTVSTDSAVYELGVRNFTVIRHII